jgi:NAD(P)-dependent dehydrogenase (short-subunit alcohol dehydrogenase family)
MLRIHTVLLTLALLSPTALSQEPPPATRAAEPRAVLVTGASSGIGRKTVELLAQNGFFVYAGARKDADLQALGAIANVQAIRLDVTEPGQIEAAVATIRAAGRGLFGLINNAGVAVLAPLIELREDDLRYQMDVNVYGPCRLTKAFAPLLIESRGRVATTGSLSGVVAWPMGGAYVMSKHAVEAFTDVLAMELRPFGVEVSVVEPGNYNSKIMANMLQRMRETGFSTEGSRYRQQLDRILAEPAGPANEPEPDAVAEAFLRVLTDEKPKRRYLVVPNQQEAEVTIRSAFARLVQLNEDQPFAYDREALVRMLDDARRGARR